MTTPSPEMPLYIDSTMTTCARSCLQKFHLEFILGLRPSGISVDLHAGGAFATALEVARRSIYQENRSLNDALQLAHGAFAVAWGDFEIPEYKKTAKTFDQTWRAVEEYFRHFPPLTDHIQPYFVDGKSTLEFTFAIPLEPAIEPPSWEYNDGERMGEGTDYDPPDAFPLHPSGDPWLYSGRFDMLGAYHGKPVIVDEKTTGRSISTGWADQWTLRNQFMGYVWAARQHGIALDSVVARGVAIQKTQIAFAEAIKMYPDHLLARWHEQLRRDLWRIRRAWDSGYFDYNFADACTAYGNCIFMPVCASTDEQKPNWYNDYEVRRWNPLQKNPIEAKEAA